MTRRLLALAFVLALLVGTPLLWLAVLHWARVRRGWVVVH